MTVFLGDFNAKLSNWCKHEKTSYGGAKFEGLAQHFGLQKITDEPTHILTKSSSCINIYFWSGPSNGLWGLPVALFKSSSLNSLC